MSGDVEDSWRQNLVTVVKGPDTSEATGALLALTFDEPDRLWMEKLLLGLIDDDATDPQVRALAVICLGHLARIHGATTAKTVVVRLKALRGDEALRSRAVNALNDIEDFTSEPIEED
ncbi:hypothetical protein ABT214_03415 [Micromonospora purpureochromogenes]|uniref:hypothetical protein n=1 Tax=Micromonospora purpureochromogenes TaxID=47872 RepID=UPI003333B40E